MNMKQSEAKEEKICIYLRVKKIFFKSFSSHDEEDVVEATKQIKTKNYK